MKKLFFLIFSILIVRGQKIESSIDKNEIKIGAPVVLTLKAPVHHSDFLVFPNLDSIGKLEVLDNLKVDTLKKGQQTYLYKRYILTQFDAGQYTIPSLEVIFNDKKIKTQSHTVQIHAIKVDTTQQKMFDIKADEKLNLNQFNYDETDLATWEVLLALVVCLILAFLVYYFVKLKQLKFNSKLPAYKSPIEKFNEELEEVKLKKNSPKLFYTQLITTFKNYFESVLKIPAQKSTSNEFLLRLESQIQMMQLSKVSTLLPELEKVLSHADGVKFAKGEALNLQLLEDEALVEKIIGLFHEQLPQSEEEIRAKEAVVIQNKRLTKQVNIRQLLAIITFSLSVVVSVFVLGWDALQSYSHIVFYGKDSAYYLEKEGFVSEYGYPVLQMETPEILVRKKGSFQDSDGVKQAQFGWQKFSDNLSIEVETTSYKDSVPVKLVEEINSITSKFKKLGGKNVLVDLKKFKNKNGQEGNQLDGSYYLHSKDIENQYLFKAILLNEKKGKHWVIFTFKKSDLLAIKLFEKISNTIQIIGEEEDE